MGSIAKAVKHMSEVHSFFIPDVEYLVDLEGLLQYLGEKISIGNICLFCNGKSFNSMESVQQHMVWKKKTPLFLFATDSNKRDQAHCKLPYEEKDEDEYLDFYDFT